MIIGITGTNGAGKGTVVDYLVQEKGFAHYSARAAIIEEIKKRGLEVHRPHMNLVATDLREKHGAHYLSDLFMKQAAERGQKDIVIESIRTIAEAKHIKESGGFLLVVDADEHIRYSRITGRGSHTDNVSFEEFQAQEAREMASEDPNNPAKMSVGAVMAMSDATVHNDGTLDELHAQVDAALAGFK